MHGRVDRHGAVGALVAQLLAPFGPVVGTTRHCMPAIRCGNAGGCGRWARGLLGTSDAVCVQLNYFSRYHGLLGERFLPFCKPDQVIVSIAHSGLFDEQALAAALIGGRIAAAWLDSLEPGALDEGRPLAGMDTLQITPRVDSTTRESRLRSAWAVARRIDELLTYAAPQPSSSRRHQASHDLEAGPCRRELGDPLPLIHHRAGARATKLSLASLALAGDLALRRWISLSAAHVPHRRRSADSASRASPTTATGDRRVASRKPGRRQTASPLTAWRAPSAPARPTR
jgi:hypothetical protein